MKTLIASLFALSLLGSVAPASAAGIGVHVGGIGVHVGGGHRHCNSWGHRHHNRYCRHWG